MRPIFIPSLVLLLCPLPGAAQDAVPLPEVPDLPLEPGLPAEPPPEAPPVPGVPRVKLAPNAPSAPAGPSVGPKVKVAPRQDVGESSIHGGQFRIFGGTKNQRDGLLRDAEATRRLVMSALKSEASFKWPILVHIRSGGTIHPGQPQVISSITQVPVESAFRFEVNLLPQEGRVPGPLLQQELVRCILAEAMLREHGDTDLSGADQPPPDWLLHGLLELLEYQALGRPSESFSAVFRLGRVLSVQDIFEADPQHMDSVSRMVYRASCCGLLLMMLDQRGGEKSLQELLKALPALQQDPAAAIARAFPGLNASGNSLGKWWSLQLAAASQPGSDEVLSPRDTEEGLVKALLLSLPAEPKAAANKPEAKPSKDKKGLGKIFGKKKKEPEKPAPEEKQAEPAGPVDVPIEQFARALAHKKRHEIFSRANLALTQLALRAHPLYRPIIDDYRGLTAALAAGKSTKEAAAKLGSLAALRARVMKDISAAEDLLDQHEYNESEGTSGAFDGYLRAADAADLPPPPRRDPISRYMDSMAEEYKDQ